MNFLNTIERAVSEGTTAPHNVEHGEWFTSKEHYLEFCAAFKKYVNDGFHPSSAHFLLYAILRNRDWTKQWTTPTNPGKQIEHEYKKASAFAGIRSPYNESGLLKPFDGTITTEMLMAVREVLPIIQKEGE